MTSILVTGKLGPFFKDKRNQRVYAGINDHLKTHVGRENCFIIDKNCKEVIIGKPLQSKAFGGELISRSAKLDSAFLAINKDVAEYCSNIVYDPDGKPRLAQVYDGSVETLFGKKVFKCHPPASKEHSKKTVTTPLCGMVESAETHKAYRSALGDGDKFLVRAEDDSMFSVEGESGTELAMLSEDSGNVYLIGTIFGGRLKESDMLTACVVRSKSTEYLKALYKVSIELLKEPILQLKDESVELLVGTRVFARIQKNLNPPDIQLAEHLMHLLVMSFSEKNPEDVPILKVKEQEYNEQLWDRNNISCTTIFEEDITRQLALENCMIACDHIYSHDFPKAESAMKQACMFMRKLDGETKLYFICKLLSDATWYYIATKEHKVSEPLLEDGLEFLEKNSQVVGFPLECLAFHYYDYSQYCYSESKDEIEQATRLAKKALDMFREIDANVGTKDSSTRLILAACQYAHTRLDCGDDFELIEHVVSKEAIGDAEDCMHSIEAKMESAPVVPRVDYLRTMCDLHFRKGDTISALNCAMEGRDLAYKADMKDEMVSADCRYKELSRRRKTFA